MTKQVIRAIVRPLCSALLLASCIFPTAPFAAQAQSGGAGKVTIYRDEWGVPNVYSDTEEGGYFGLGYAQVEDGLELFALRILIARGTLAATVSPDELPPHLRKTYASADMFVENDYQVRLWNIRARSEESLARLNPQLLRNYSEFARGARRFLQDHKGKVPSWVPTDITAGDLVALGQWSLWSVYQAGVGLDDCRRGGIAPADARTAGNPLLSAPPATRGMSNEWAVMPARTATGGAILLTDPHGGIVSDFYEFRMHAGNLHAAGFVLGAIPVTARNARVGWGMTTGSPDVADCMRIDTTSPENTAYLYDGKSRPIMASTVEIPVKGQPSRRITVKYTDHNGVYSPVVREIPGVAFVVSTPYVDNLEGFHNAMYGMLRSRDVEEWRKSFSLGGVFPQNLLAADTRGDIMYVRAGLVPRRDPSRDWTLVQDGNSSESAWRGIHPGADLFSIKSPKAGFLQNNNVHPQLMSDPPFGELAGVPAYMIDDGRWPGDNARAAAGRKELAAIDRMDEKAAFGLALSTKLNEEGRWMQLVAAVLKPHIERASGSRLAFMKDLLAFDGVLDAASTSALKYIYFREELRRGMSNDEAIALARWFDSGTDIPPALKGRFIGALDMAYVRSLTMPRGLDRSYGDEFRLATGEGTSAPMSGGTIKPASGLPKECGMIERLCSSSLYLFHYSDPDKNGERLALAGSRMLRLDFYSSTGIRSFSVQNPGQSRNPGDPHADDQSRALLSKGRLKPIRFEWSDLKSHVSKKTVLDMD